MHIHPSLFCTILLITTWGLHAQTWQTQPIAQPVPGLWGISMFDGERGVAVGNAAISNGFSGIVRRLSGNPTWQLVPPGSFTPALSSGFSFWSGVSSLRTTGISYVCGASSMIYKSTDYGATWQRTTTGISGGGSFFDIHFKNANEGLVVGAGGIAYYTTDGGANWTAQTTGTSSGLYSVHTAGNIWYIGGASNTMMKFTPPSTWTNISANLPPGTFPLIEGLQFLSDQVGTFSGYNSGGSSHVFRTSDGGASWQAFPTQPPVGALPFYSSIFFFTNKIGWVANIFDPVAYTADGGNSWTTYTPSGSGTGAVTRMDFNSQQLGWASGGALGGGPIPQGFILRYDGPPPTQDISRTAATVDFGTVRCVGRKDTTVWIRNSGTLDLTIPAGGITFTDPDFTVVAPATPFTVPSADSVAVTIRWTIPTSMKGPIPAGVKMKVKSNDPVHPTWDITIAGFRPYSNVTLSSFSITFPLICGSSFSDTTIVVTPDASIPPVLLALEYVSGDSTLVLLSPPLNTVLSGPTTFQFRFKPVRPGLLHTEYRLIIGDPDCPQNYHLSIDVENRKTTFLATPAIVDFGDLCVGVARDIDINMKNEGSVPGSIVRRELVSGADVFPNLYAAPFGPVPNGSSAPYKVRFLPPDTGTYTAVYRLISGPCADTTIITLRGRGVRVNIQTRPVGSFTLGPVSINQTATDNVTFTNNGTAPVTVASILINPPNGALTLSGLPGLPAVLNPGQGLSCTVVFKPTKIEAFITGLCLVLTLPCNDTICLPLKAVSADPPTIATRTGLSIAVQNCAAPVRDSFYVSNLGPGPLNLQSFTVTGPDASHFRIVRPVPPVLVQAPDSVAIVVEHNSPVEGTSSATLTINHNDPKPGNKSIVTLSGARTVTEFVVEGDSITPLVACLKTTVTRRFTVRNPGPRPLQVTELSVSQGAGVYGIIGDSLPMDIPPSSSRQFTVTFTPTAAGPVGGRIRIVSEPCTYTVILPVPGIGKSSDIVVNPASVNFGTVTVGSASSRQIQVTNTGTETATVTGLILRPSNPALSIVSPPAFPFTLTPNSSRSVTVEFRPTAPGSLLAQVCVLTDSPCQDTVCASVLGLGQAEGIAFDPADLEIVLDPCTASASCDTTMLVNNSARDLTIIDITFDQPGFSLSPPLSPPFPLSSGTRRLLVVCAQGNFTGERSAKLFVRSDDPNRPVIELPIRAVRDSQRIEADLTTIDFGKVACDTPKTRSVTFRNTGTVANTLIIVRRPSAPFTLMQSGGMVIDSGGVLTLQARFAPTARGAFRDTLIVEAWRCRQRFVIVLAGENPAVRYELTPRPLAFSSVPIGASESRDLTVRNIFLGPSRISNIRFIPAGEFSHAGSLPVQIDSNRSADLSIRFSPSAKGARTAMMILDFDQPCSESDTVALNGTGTDVPIYFTPSPLAFGIRAQCEQTLLADTLVNGGAAAVTLNSSTVSGTGQAAFTILNPVTAPEQLSPGGRRVFTVRFTPASPPDGPVTAALTVTTDDPAQPSIDLPLAGERTTVTYPGQIDVNFGTLQFGFPAQQVFTLQNPSTLPIIFSGANLPPGVALTPPPPYTVGPGQSIQITVTYTPDSPGSQIVPFFLASSRPCLDSTLVRLIADVTGGIALRDLFFGFVPNCTETAGTLTLRNGLSASISVTSLRISGTDSSAFRILSPTSLPVSIAAGDSLMISVTVVPDSNVTRSYFANLLAGVEQGTLKEVHSSVLIAQTYEPVPMLSQSIDFGDVTITTPSASRRLVFRNIYPQPIRVVDIRSLDPAFLIEFTPALPTVLQPLDSMIVGMHFTPVDARDYSGIVEVITDQPCRGFWSYPAVIGRGIDDLVHADISIPDLSGRVDERIRIPVMLNTDVGSAHVTEWRGGVMYDPTMLYFLGLITEGTKSAGMTVDTLFSDVHAGEIRIVARGGEVQPGAGPLIYLECLVLIGAQPSTPLSILPWFDFYSGKARVYTRADGSFSLVDYCDAGGTRFVRQVNSLTLSQNRPNPFNASTMIEYTIPWDGDVELTLSNALGMPIEDLVRGYRIAGRHRIEVDGGHLLSGVYFYTLRHSAGQLSRRMVVSK